MRHYCTDKQSSHSHTFLVKGSELETRHFLTNLCALHIEKTLFSTHHIFSPCTCLLYRYISSFFGVISFHKPFVLFMYYNKRSSLKEVFLEGCVSRFHSYPYNPRFSSCTLQFLIEAIFQTCATGCSITHLQNCT